MKEQQATWGDPWQYGIKANQPTIDTFIRYNVEQGMIRRALSCEEIFAAGTLNT
jgi:4,5-dihydroxyphthalate decarboxylase